MSKSSRYFKILDGIKEGQSTLNNDPNSRVLLVDGLNTFIRAFAANPATNENGVHIGGMAGFLLSIGYAIKNIKPTRVIICFDGAGGSVRRKKLYSGYKENRKNKVTPFRQVSLSVADEEISMQQQMVRLLEYLEKMPLTVLCIDNIEADDSIAYISQQIYTEAQCFIMSTDKDFLQLVDKRVAVWSPTKKKYYFDSTIKEEFGVEAHNFLEYRTFIGDTSDGIGGIKGAGPKTLQKIIPMLFESDKVEMDDIKKFVTDSESTLKLLAAVRNSFDIVERNYILMQLKEVDISGHAKTSISNQVINPIPRLNKMMINKMILEDMMNGSIKNPDLWLREVFFTLDAMASKTHS